MPLRIPESKKDETPEVTVDRLREALMYCGRVDYCTDCPLYVGERCRFAGTYLAWLDRAVAVIGQLTREYEGMMEDKIGRTSFDPMRDRMRLKGYVSDIRKEFGIGKK